MAQPAHLTYSLSTAFCFTTDRSPEATPQNTTPLAATFSCAHTTTPLPHTGIPFEANARDNTLIRAYAHPCKKCHRSCCEAAQEIIEALYLPRINGYNMRIERMTELIAVGKGGREMVEARKKRYWQGMDVWEQMVSVDFWLWKPYVERWGDLGFVWEEGWR